MASQKRCVRPPTDHNRKPRNSPAPLRCGESVRASSRMSGASICISGNPNFDPHSDLATGFGGANTVKASGSVTKVPKSAYR